MGMWSLLTIQIPACIAGIPWILDLVTSVIQHEHGFDDSCYLTISLDAVNLLNVDTETYNQIPVTVQLCRVS